MEIFKNKMVGARFLFLPNDLKTDTEHSSEKPLLSADDHWIAWRLGETEEISWKIYIPRKISQFVGSGKTTPQPTNGPFRNHNKENHPSELTFVVLFKSGGKFGREIEGAFIWASEDFVHAEKK